MPAAVDANGRFPDIFFYRFRAARPNAKIGYAYGWRSPEYLKAVEAVDADIGRVIAAYVLGIRPARVWTGRVINDIFE